MSSDIYDITALSDASDEFLTSESVVNFDNVVTKLEWGASTESRQFSDAVSVIRITDKAFDLACARKWANELDLSDLFDQAIAEARATPLD
jgi:hypothetical protein